MRRAVAAVAILLAFAGPATGSLVEDTLAPTGAGIHYQEDGGVPGDAPATCEAVDPARDLALGGSEPTNLLVDHDDEMDAFAFPLAESDVGERVAVDLLTRLLSERHDIAFDVRSPDCASSVFDPGSAYYDPPPADPYPEPTTGVQREATLAGHACDPAQWKFLANQMGGLPAPRTIYVEWTDGSHDYVPVTKSTPATVAMYLTSAHLDVTVARAVIVLPAAWTGQFKLASGPCDAAVGTPDPAPVQGPRSGEFTVQEAGTHVVLVYVSRGTVEKTQDTVEALVADPPTSVNANCHRDVCSLALSDMAYDLGASYAS